MLRWRYFPDNASTCGLYYLYLLSHTKQEVVTGKVPYPEYKTDGGIYGALNNKKPPIRPEELAVENERADKIWALLLQCWDHNAVARPSASEVLAGVRIRIRY